MCPMRSLALSLAVILFAHICLGQSIDVKSSRSEEVPMYRPALVGSGPDALINQIDEKGLIDKGQKDAVIMFSCQVNRTGGVQWASYYGATPDSGPLLEELINKISAAKFIPAIYNRVPVDVVFFGTVSFAVVDGKPRLRIFSNQEKEELRKESDFISPQPFFGKDSKFEGWHYPPIGNAPIAVKATVELEVEIDEQGLLGVISVVEEEPPLLGFAKLAAEDTAKARFIPAFRGGKPVASKTTLHLNFSPPVE
jgi:hypothetical protein